MDESLNLVRDLALIFISAGIITLIFRALKQPLILGYIVAGFLVGPHFGLFPGLTNPENVEQWSEIGIIFLLFALGREFSFKKLLKVGSSALITAGTIFAGMFVTGMAIGGAMGWSHMERIFLGGMLSMSSTTIIIKAFDDLGLKGKPFTNIVFGTLVVEDLLAVVLMVLLSTMAVSKQFAGGEMVMALLKLLFFLVLWFVVGMYLIPTLFKKGRRVMNEEMLVILSVGLCFGMVALATAAGFSSALGAFVMGSLLAETLEGERISHSIKSIKDLFGAIFFVSVGMMVDPAIIAQYWKPILILIAAVVIGIPLFATSGVLMAGQGLHSAVRSGFSMAQIGEFAFIIASLGKSLGVMADYIYPVV
ncbi:MAG: cation:proton antiporter, partial [Bacteroidales bacterium]|nr:cation:proton antiporter [Bacteroidales bacterium]